tara:strand:+ start:1002 stop:1187 length:186 start_codon:yes stop_codon:yes gene_type:complete
MSEETEWAIEDIRQSIHILNENLVMIAYQLYISNHKGMEEYATIKNFLSDLKNIQKEVNNQ